MALALALVAATFYTGYTVSTVTVVKKVDRPSILVDSPVTLYAPFQGEELIGNVTFTVYGDQSRNETVTYRLILTLDGVRVVSGDAGNFSLSGIKVVERSSGEVAGFMSLTVPTAIIERSVRLETDGTYQPTSLEVYDLYVVYTATDEVQVEMDIFGSTELISVQA